MRSPLSRIGLALALVGLLRLALVVFHEPLLGYANQFDTLRVSACVGLYPDLPGEARYGPSPWMPIEPHARGSARDEGCVRGSEVAIAALALAVRGIASNEAKVSLRWIGGTGLAIAALLVLAAAAALWRFPWAALLHGATVAAVLGDPLAGLWFNTLYAEVPIIFGAYAMAAGLVAIALAGRAGVAAAALVVAGALLLGLSKVQFFLLPAVFVLAALPMLLRASRAFAAVAGVAALVPIAVLLLPGKEGAVPANRVNAYLGALASSSNDPAGTLSRLGLPQRCRPLVGASWFLRRGEDLEAVCPEAKTLGNGAFLELAAGEPRTVARAFVRGVAFSQNAFTGHLGFVAGVRYGGFEHVAPWNRSLWEPVFLHLPARLFAALLAFALAASALTALAYVGLAWRRPQSAGTAFALHGALLGIAIAYTYATSIVGDGFSDFGKHMVLGAACLAAGLLALAGWIVHSWTHPGRTARVASIAIVLVSAAAAFAFSRGYESTALAFGVIDHPVGRMSAGPFTIEGWALDPNGVATVEARVGAKRFPAASGLESAALERIFPTLPDATRAGYRVEIPADALDAQHPVLRVIATGRNGRESELDRRRLAEP